MLWGNRGKKERRSRGEGRRKGVTERGRGLKSNREW